MQLKTVTKNKIEVQTNKISDDVLIKGILNNDSQIIRHIYFENFEKIKVMVLNFNNIRIDPQDVFQEGLTRAVINIRKGVFKGESKFSTYLYSICRNICLSEYKEKKHLVSNECIEESDQNENDYFELLQQVLKLRNGLNMKCREIIDLRFNLNISDDNNNKTEKFESIALKLGINADNARQRFKRCIAKFKNMVLNNPHINLILS